MVYFATRNHANFGYIPTVVILSLATNILFQKVHMVKNIALSFETSLFRDKLSDYRSFTVYLYIFTNLGLGLATYHYDPNY